MQARRYDSGKALYGVTGSGKLFNLEVFGTPAFKPQPHYVWRKQEVVIRTEHIRVAGTCQLAPAWPD